MAACLPPSPAAPPVSYSSPLAPCLCVFGRLPPVPTLAFPWCLCVWMMDQLLSLSGGVPSSVGASQTVGNLTCKFLGVLDENTGSGWMKAGKDLSSVLGWILRQADAVGPGTTPWERRTSTTMIAHWNNGFSWLSNGPRDSSCSFFVIADPPHSGPQRAMTDGQG